MAERTTEHLAENPTDLHDQPKSLAASVNNLRTDFAGFRGSMESDMRTIRWAGSFFAAILVVLVGCAINPSWQAAVLNTDVKVQGSRLEKVEQRLDRADQQLDQIERRFDRVNAQLAAVLQRSDQAKAIL